MRRPYALVMILAAVVIVAAAWYQTSARRAAPETTSSQPAVSPLNGGSGGADPAAVVHMTDSLGFVPSKVTIEVGQIVEWKNTSQLVHTVTCDPKLAANPADVELPKGAKPFNSGDIPPGRTYTHKFLVAGEYKYFCIPHESDGMIGYVEVQK